MRYTAVFEWPEGQAPRISKRDTWNGGELCAVAFNDSLDELQRLKEAVYYYCDHYLRAEIDDPDLWCYDDQHRKSVEAVWAALGGAQ